MRRPQRILTLAACLLLGGWQASGQALFFTLLAQGTGIVKLGITCLGNTGTSGPTSFTATCSGTIPAGASATCVGYNLSLYTSITVTDNATPSSNTYAINGDIVGPGNASSNYQAAFNGFHLAHSASQITFQVNGGSGVLTGFDCAFWTGDVGAVDGNSPNNTFATNLQHFSSTTSFSVPIVPSVSNGIATCFIFGTVGGFTGTNGWTFQDGNMYTKLLTASGAQNATGTMSSQSGDSVCDTTK